MSHLFYFILNYRFFYIFTLKLDYSVEQEIKQSIYEEAKKHVNKTCDIMKRALSDTRETIDKGIKDLSSVRSQDQLILSNSITQNQKRLGELKKLQSSPYFVRCDLIREDGKEKETWYFSKFNFSDESKGQDLSSWMWDFGNGNTSSEKNPMVKYRSPGIYTVKLVVSNSLGANLQRKINFINVTSE